MPIEARVITCSDAAARGEREDRSGPAVRAMLEERGYAVGGITVVQDEIDEIAAAIVSATDSGARLVVTTGGTGIAPRDVTPEATARVTERMIPGFGELMRMSSRASKPIGALSRAEAATRGTALVVNLPGSVNGAKECLAAVIDLIPHALELLAGGSVNKHPV
ncbi:MAG TPA: MogA/MoaB family molybdenum cofactor biosynthesis protein [Thermoanaerobaculia bacterium]|nr:MogA/MoaB family molybdenum cofactor biosynthesis protein [Thermoanaerobaculia bacterium]